MLLQLHPAFKLVSLTLATLLITAVSAAPIVNFDAHSLDCVKVTIPSVKSSGDRRFVLANNDWSVKIDVSNCDPSVVNMEGPRKITLVDLQGDSTEIDVLTKDHMDYTWKIQQSRTLCSTKEYYLRVESENIKSRDQGQVTIGRSGSFTISCPSTPESITSTLTTALHTRGDDLPVDPLLPPVKKDAPPAAGSDPSTAPLTLVKPAMPEAPTANDMTSEKEAVVSVPSDTIFSPAPPKASSEDVDPSIVPPPTSEAPVFPSDAVPSTPAESPLTVPPAPAEIAPIAQPVPVTSQATVPVNTDTTASFNNALSSTPAAFGSTAADTSSTTPPPAPGGDPEAEANEKARKSRSVSTIFYKYVGLGSAALSLVGLGAGGIVGGLVGSVVGLAVGLVAALANSAYYA